MDIPERVRVSPYWISLRPDPQACRASECTGQYLGDEHVIIYDDGPGVAPGILLDSLVHELLHALWNQSGASLIVDDTGEKSKGEQVIRALTPRLIGLLQDNPFLVKLICEEETL